MDATISLPDNTTGSDSVWVDEMDGESVTVEFPDRGTQCQHCGEEISDYGDNGWQADDGGERDCPQHTTECEECDGVGAIFPNWPEDKETQEDCPNAACDRGTVNLGHEPSDTATVDTFANSAGIHVSNDGTELTVTISVGDPRGAFGMTVRKLPDGRLILHVPYADEPMGHRTLVEMHPGTYEIK